MKKLLAILMTITMCFSFVVVASAENFSGHGYKIDVKLDGDWYALAVPFGYNFETKNGTNLYIEGTNKDKASYMGSLDKFHESIIAKLKRNFNIEDGSDALHEIQIDGCPAVMAEEISADRNETIIIVRSDEYVYEIRIVDSGNNNAECLSLLDSVLNMELNVPPESEDTEIEYGEESEVYEETEDNNSDENTDENYEDTVTENIEDEEE